MHRRLFNNTTNLRYWVVCRGEGFYPGICLKITKTQYYDMINKFVYYSESSNNVRNKDEILQYAKTLYDIPLNHCTDLAFGLVNDLRFNPFPDTICNNDYLIYLAYWEYA